MPNGDERRTGGGFSSRTARAEPLTPPPRLISRGRVLQVPLSAEKCETTVESSQAHCCRQCVFSEFVLKPPSCFLPWSCIRDASARAEDGGSAAYHQACA